MHIKSSEANRTVLLKITFIPPTLTIMKVVVAGANSGIGAHIIDAILAKQKHDVIALIRRPSPDLEAKGAKVSITDYSSVESLTAALSGVHTVISAIGSLDGKLLAKNELALVQAAEKAGNLSPEEKRKLEEQAAEKGLQALFKVSLIPSLEHPSSI